MTVQRGLKCSQECDFIIALQGHDYETINKGLESYEECPTCGAELIQTHCYQPDLGFLKVSAPVKGDWE